jgi:hypothetical protein
MSEFADFVDSPEMTAHHEAGHAVAYAARGVAFRYATLRPRDPRSHGRVVSYSVLRSSAVDDLLISHAGAVAETLWMATTWGIEYCGVLAGGYHDYADIHRIYNEFPELRARQDDYHEQAFDLVERHWPLIQKVAARLLAEKTVSGPEITRMFWRSLDAARIGGAR